MYKSTEAVVNKRYPRVDNNVVRYGYVNPVLQVKLQT